MQDEIKKKTYKELVKFCDNFPFKSNDHISIILKGHLLIEELLIAHTNKILKNPKYIQNFKFFHYLCLAKAMEKDKQDEWIWDACRKLNNLRNKLSHQLKPQGIEHLIKDFVNFIKEKESKFPDRLIKDFGELKMCILALHMKLACKLHLPKYILGRYNALLTKNL